MAGWVIWKVESGGSGGMLEVGVLYDLLTLVIVILNKECQEFSVAAEKYLEVMRGGWFDMVCGVT